MNGGIEKDGGFHRMLRAAGRFGAAALLHAAWWTLVLGALGAGSHLVQQWWWVFENVAAFRVQVLVMLLFSAGYWILRKRWILALAAAGFAAIPTVSLAPLFTASGAAAVRGEGSARLLRIVFTNVLTSNRDYGRVIEFIARSRADVVVLAEVDAGWLAALAPLRGRYPHWLHRVRSDNFGIALLSTTPILGGRIATLAQGAGPTVVGEVRPPGVAPPLKVIGVHLFPPVSAFGAEQRDLQAAGLARLASRVGGRVVVVGDLNMTDASPAFGRLLQATGLRDSRRGFGIQSTWPVGNLLMWLPLDHALVSPDLVVIRRIVGPDVGSDHYPIVVDIGRGNARVSAEAR